MEIYGRDEETNVILECYEQSRGSAARLLLISGQPGVGKTVIVEQGQKMLAGRGCRFTGGRYEHRATPYAGLIAASQGLIQQLPSKKLLELQRYIYPLTAVFPELWPARQQSILPSVDCNETQNRLHYAFQQFVEPFCNRDRPLVVFLDDLQWVDNASLTILQTLLRLGQNMLVIGAYRDNEAQQNQSLQKIIAIADEQLSVKPLQPQFVRLFCPNVNDNLSTTIYAQSKGIPLRIEILLRVYAKGSDLETEIEECVKLMFSCLPESCQSILKTAACLGSQFEVELIAAACTTSCSEIDGQLQPAIAEGIIYPVNQSYEFWHDVIRDCIYDEIPASLRAARHLQIGETLLYRNMATDFLFVTVNQLNLGIPATDRPKLKSIVQLNLTAATHAKQAAAFDTAQHYLDIALRLSTDDTLEINHDLVVELYLIGSEVAYAVSDFSRSRTFAHNVLNTASAITEKSKAYELIIQSFTAENQMESAIDTALLALENTGLVLLQEPPNLSIADLANLPDATDPRCMAILRVLRAACTSTYVVNPSLFLRVIFTMVDTCSVYGISPLSSYSYSLYGLLCCGPLGNIETGYAIGRLALELLNKLKTNENTAKATDIFNGHIRPWWEHLKNSQDPLLECINTGLSTGDIEYAGFAAINHCANTLILGQKLDACKVSHQDQAQLVENLNLEYHKLYMEVGQWTIDCLLGVRTNEADIISRLLASQHGPGLAYIYTSKSMISYHLDDAYTEAIAASDHAEQYVPSAAGLPIVAIHNYYQSLSFIAHYPQASESDRPPLLAKVEANQEKMRTWANHCPENFEHKFQLVEAERARVLGQGAIAHYELAIHGARENGYIQEEALALERLGDYYILSDIYQALACLEDARTTYGRWGAKAKVEQLDEKIDRLQLTCQLLERFAKKCELPPGSKVYRELSGDKQITLVIQAPGLAQARAIWQKIDAIALVAQSIGLASNCAIEIAQYHGRKQRLPSRSVQFYIKSRERIMSRQAIGKTNIEILRLFDGPESCGGVDQESGRLIWASLAIQITSGKSYCDMIGTNINELWTPKELSQLQQDLKQEGQLIDPVYWAYSWQLDEHGLWQRVRHQFRARKIFLGYIAGRLTRFSLGVEIVQ